MLYFLDLELEESQTGLQDRPISKLSLSRRATVISRMHKYYLLQGLSFLESLLSRYIILVTQGDPFGCRRVMPPL